MIFYLILVVRPSSRGLRAPVVFGSVSSSVDSVSPLFRPGPRFVGSRSHKTLTLFRGRPLRRSPRYRDVVTTTDKEFVLLSLRFPSDGSHGSTGPVTPHGPSDPTDVRSGLTRSTLDSTGQEKGVSRTALPPPGEEEVTGLPDATITPGPKTRRHEACPLGSRGLVNRRLTTQGGRGRETRVGDPGNRDGLKSE